MQKCKYFYILLALKQASYLSRIMIIILFSFCGVVLSYGQSNNSVDAEELLIIIQRLDEGNRPDNNDDIVKHRSNMKQLIHDGILQVVGLFKQGGGIFISKSMYQDHIISSFNNDPYYINNRLTIEIKPFGDSSINMCLDNQNCPPTDFKLVIYYVNLNKNTIKLEPEMYQQHLSHINLLATLSSYGGYGSFGRREGDFIFFEGSELPDLITDDPALFSNFMVYEYYNFQACAMQTCK